MMAGEEMQEKKRRPSSSSSSTTAAAAAVASLRNWFDKLRGAYTQQQARRSSIIAAALNRASGPQTPLLRAGVSMFNITRADATAPAVSVGAASVSCWLEELDHSPVKRPSTAGRCEPLAPLSKSSSRPLSCYELTAADQQQLRGRRSSRYCETHFPTAASPPLPLRRPLASLSVNTPIDIDRHHQQTVGHE